MTLFGPDGSHHQDPDARHDPFAVAGADWRGIDYLIWRCSIRDRLDRTFPWAMENAKQRNIPFKAYHFIYPTGTGAWPADEQAEACLDALAGDTSIPVMLDWESDVWKNKQGQVTREFFPDFDDVLAVANAMRSLGIKVPTLYTGEGYWRSKGSPRLTGHGFDLVNARWGANPQVASARSHYGTIGGDSGAGWTGYGGLDPIIWQFGSVVKFGNRHMDHNACRADPADLERWFRIWTKSDRLPTGGASGPTRRAPLNWDLDDDTIADIVTCPPTVDVLAGKVDQWWAVWAIKTIQRAADLPVTGHWDQRTAEASIQVH
jgi:hypothetical protein